MARPQQRATKNGTPPSPWKTALVALLLVAGTILATVFLTSYLLSGTTPLEILRETASPSVIPPPQHDLGQFTVNLSGTGRSSFMRTNIVVEVNDRRVLSEVRDREIQLRDRVINIIRNYGPAQLADASGYVALREELLNAMDREMLRGRITRVYFTEFVIQ